MEKITVADEGIKKVVEFIQSIKYGSVNIIIQDGKIVQIERNEKLKIR